MANGRGWPRVSAAATLFNDYTCCRNCSAQLNRFVAALGYHHLRYCRLNKTEHTDFFSEGDGANGCTWHLHWFSVAACSCKNGNWTVLQRRQRNQLPSELPHWATDWEKTRPCRAPTTESSQLVVAATWRSTRLSGVKFQTSFAAA